MLLEEIKSGNIGELNTISNYIQQSLASIENIITKTLEVANSKEKAKDEVLNILQLIDEAQQLIDLPVNFKLGINCQNPLVQGNKVEILQILMNLITNSVKYCDKINCEMHFDVLDLGDFFQFTITDNGRGIQAEKLKDIFKLFNKDDDKSKDSNGVGLTIVKSIIESRGGVIDITSKEGISTEVKFTWPKIVLSKYTNPSN